MFVCVQCSWQQFSEPCQCQILSSVGGGALTGRNSNVSPPPPRGENTRDQRLRDQQGHTSHLVQPFSRHTAIGGDKQVTSNRLSFCFEQIKWFNLDFFLPESLSQALSISSFYKSLLVISTSNLVHSNFCFEYPDIFLIDCRQTFMKRRHLKFAGTLKSIYLFLYLLFYSVDSLLFSILFLFEC